MAKEMFISSSPHETKVAVLEDDLLVEVYYERDTALGLVGGIYKGRVNRVLPGMQSAFVDIGLERDAFLYVSDYFFEDQEEYDKVFEEAESRATRYTGEQAAPVQAAELAVATSAASGTGVLTAPSAPAEAVELLPPSPASEAPSPEAHPAEPVSSTPAEVAPVPSTPPASTPPAGFTAGESRGGYPQSGTQSGEGSDHRRFDPRSRRHRRRGRRGFGEYRRPERPERPYTSRPETFQPHTFEILPGESLAKYSHVSTAAPQQELATPAETAGTPSLASDAGPGLPPVAAGAGVGTTAPLEEPGLPTSSEHVAAVPADAGIGRAEPSVAPPAEVAELEQPSVREAADPFREATLTVPDSAPAVLPPEIAPTPILESEPARPAIPHVADPAPAPSLGSTDSEAAHLAVDSTSLTTPDSPVAEGESREASGEAVTEHVLGEAASETTPTEVASFAPTNGSEPAASSETAPAGETPPGAESSPQAGEMATATGPDQPAAGGDRSYTLREPHQRPRFAPRRGRRGRRGMGQRDRAPSRAEGRREAPRPGTHPPLQIAELLKEGQEILVQIAKEPLGTKGARITSHVALPGRYLVYMPTIEHIGVSRKIASEEERLRLRNIILENKGPLTGGFIVRTAGQGRSEEEFKADLRFLSALWNEIRNKAEKTKAPALIHRDLDLVQRLLRDTLTPDFKSVRVDNEIEYERVLDFVNRSQPSLVGKVKLYTRDTAMFEEFGVQAEIEKALKPKVWLKSGGYIVINQTEALVAVDVNTGKYVGKTNRLEDTILKTNIDAVNEIVRQVRLRDLGGIIVIDFIDMDERKNRFRVVQALEEALRKDRAPTKVISFHDFGLVAITRKRVKQSLERTLCEPCNYCTGSGWIKSVATVCYEILAEARKMAKQIEGDILTLRVNPEVAKALKSREGVLLSELESITHKDVIIKSDPLVPQERFEIF